MCRLYPWMQDANDPAGNQHGWRRYELTEVQSSNRMDKFVRLQLSEEQEADFLAWVNDVIQRVIPKMQHRLEQKNGQNRGG